ncbi:MAG: GAF domain-containing protein [Chryseotalea sp.]
MKLSLSRAQKYTLLFAFIGIVITALTLYSQINMLNTYERNLPYMALGDHVKNNVTKGHLWFEEYMAGDQSLHYEKDVRILFLQSEKLLHTSLANGVSDLGEFKDLGDPESIKLIEESLTDVQALLVAADERNKFKVLQVQQVSDSTQTESKEVAGGELDQRFDAAYEETQATLDKLIVLTRNRVKADSAFLQKLSWVSVSLMVGAFTLLTFLIYRYQVGNDSMIESNAKKLQEDHHRISVVSSYVQEISKGNYTASLSLNTAEDTLAATLQNLANTLSANADTETKRNWATTGLAEIGQILRNNHDASALYDTIIRFVVKYTKSNQGGLFILSEDEANPTLELVACYAFERKKFMKKSVNIGEGLVGQCFVEGDKIIMKQLPEDYIQITSGLGGANPSSVLLTPLKVNEKIYGVLEIASFNHYPDFEIELVEKLSESIAATISTVRINESTRILLERTQQQAEEMRAQEEEMRQNMEELEATQEEMRRKEKHVQTMLDQEKQRNDIIKKGRGAIMQLTKNKDIQTGNWENALEQITKTVSELIQASRVSVWLYDAAEEKITCAKLYAAHNTSFSDGFSLFRKNFPDYFKAMLSEEVIIAPNARSHQATAGFTESYFTPLDIYSLLDVPFFNNGKIAGVICCEHQGEIKNWKEEEVDLCKNCCDLITIAYKSWQFNTLEQTLKVASTA